MEGGSASTQQWHHSSSAGPPPVYQQSSANASIDKLYTEQLDDPDLEAALEELKSGTLVAEQDAEPEPGAESDVSRIVRRRATYSREHKLAAIHFATKTWITDQNGTRGIGRQQAAKILHVSWAVLSQWLTAANEIAAMPAGSLKNRKKGRTVSSLPAPHALNRRVAKTYAVRRARNYTPKQLPTTRQAEKDGHLSRARPEKQRHAERDTGQPVASRRRTVKWSGFKTSAWPIVSSITELLFAPSSSEWRGSLRSSLDAINRVASCGASRLLHA